MQLTATPPLLGPARPDEGARPARETRDDGNPWRLPQVDRALAERGLAAIEDAQRAINRMIDRSIDVRVMLDRDIKAKTLSSDTVRAVSLLVRARDYANEQARERQLTHTLIGEIDAWAESTGDSRVTNVTDELRAMRDSMYDLLDDDEGNNRERIAAMSTDPSLGLWQSVREILDWGIATMYGARDASTAEHILRAGGGLYA